MKYFFSNFGVWVCLASLSILFTACNSTKKALDKYENCLMQGGFQQAADIASAQATKSSSDKLMWDLLAANAQSIHGNLEESIRLFDVAEDAFLANDKTSVFSKGATTGYSMLTNDRAFDYDGNGQERIFCCLYKAIDFATQGRRDAARTELNRAAQYQENWLFDRKKDIAAARERLDEDAARYKKEKNVTDDQNEQVSRNVFSNAAFCNAVMEQCNYDMSRSGNLERLSEADYYNAYLAYFCGVFRWLNGDGGRNFIKDASQLYPQNPVLQEDFNAVNAHVSPKETVWVFIEDGLCPCREEWRIDLPVVCFPYAGNYVLYAGMALPYLRYRPNGAASYALTANGQTTPFYSLEDIDKLIKTEYDVYMRGAIMREITRTVVKASAQVALGILADNTNNVNEQTGLKLAQIGVATWAASTTAADLRSWTSLPKSALIQRIQRPADGTITIQADATPLSLTIPEGNSIVWIRKIAPGAPLVAKVINFPAH